MKARFQRGMVMLWAMVFIIVGATITLMQVYDIAGSRSTSAGMQVESTSALFVAESGMQRAQSILMNSGALDATACQTTVAAGGPFTMGGGQFQYTGLSFSSSGANNAQCLVQVKGVVGGASRTVEGLFASLPSDEGAGCGSSLALSLPVQFANAVAFTNTAYRAKAGAYTCVADPGNSNAIIGSCVLTRLSDNTTSACSSGWSLERTGTTNVSGHGAFQSAPNTGAYSIKLNLIQQGGGQPATRNYVVTGLVAYPAAGYSAVEYIGSYSADTGSDKTTSASQVTGSIDEDWTCQTNSGSLSNQMGLAARADTLLYGFSSWPQAGANPDNVFLTLGAQPFRRIKTRSSNTGDNVYSQAHFTYNRGYYPLNSGNTLVTGATNGANFTGAVGAVVTGSISGTTLSVTSNSGSGRYGELRNGDTLSGTGISAGTLVSGNCSGTTPPYTCPVNNSQTVASTTLTATSNILRVTVLASGVLTADDAITTGIAGSPTILDFSTAGTTGTGSNAGDYVLSAKVGPVNATSMQSSGKTITLPAGVVAIPNAGTAVAVSSGTGTISGVVFSGTLSAGSLTSSATVTLCEGDALFGHGYRAADNTEFGVLPNTTITGPSGCTTGTGPWTVSGTANASGSFLARTGVMANPAPTATSFKLSRTPTIRLSNSAVVCGGVCALLFDQNNTMNTGFSLAGVTAGDDWASGFACLSGVDSANIDTIGLEVRRMGGWREVVQ